MIAEVAALLDRFLAEHWRPGGRSVHLLGTSGTVTTIAGVHLELRRYERRRVDGCWMVDDEIDPRDRTPAGLELPGSRRQCLHRRRARRPRARRLRHPRCDSRRLPVPRLRVADRGLREGMLVQMMREDASTGALRHGTPMTTRGGGRDLKVRVKTGKRSLSSQALAGAPAQRPLRRARQARRLSRARRLQADRDRRQFGCSRHGGRVVDLGAAPGGWSQVAAHGSARRRARAQVVAIDSPRRWTRSGRRIHADGFPRRGAPDKIKRRSAGRADVVLSDMAATTTGHRTTDHLRIVGLAKRPQISRVRC